jgi:hypothetical protein
MAVSAALFLAACVMSLACDVSPAAGPVIRKVSTNCPLKAGDDLVITVEHTGGKAVIVKGGWLTKPVRVGAPDGRGNPKGADLASPVTIRIPTAEVVEDVYTLAIHVANWATDADVGKPGQGLGAVPHRGFTTTETEVRFRGHVPKGTVKPERTRIVFESRDHVNFPWAVRSPDGTIWLSFSTGTHTRTETGNRLWSLDNGKTWQRPDKHLPGIMTCPMPGGKVMHLQAWAARPVENNVFPMTVRVWPDPRSTTSENRKVRVRIPLPIAALNLHRTLLRRPDGTLLATAYATIDKDGGTVSFCLASRDEGKTWSYLSTIARGRDGKPGREAYCEPAMVQLADGDLLCFLRTGNSGPLMQTRSTDGGKTWDEPRKIAPAGVDPHAIVLSDGTLVVSFGRPGVSLLVDFDGTGQKWDKAVSVYRGMGCGYTSLVEIEPGVLMVLYTESGLLHREGPGPLNRMMAAYVRIRKLGK